MEGFVERHCFTVKVTELLGPAMLPRHRKWLGPTSDFEKHLIAGDFKAPIRAWGWSGAGAIHSLTKPHGERRQAFLKVRIAWTVHLFCLSIVSMSLVSTD